jgi:hypothetical protein
MDSASDQIDDTDSTPVGRPIRVGRIILGRIREVHERRDRDARPTRGT